MGTTATWAHVVRSCAVLSSVIALGRGLAMLDRESIAVGAALAVATALTFTGSARLRRLGWVAVAALFLNQAAWMIGATWSLTSAAPSTAGAAVPAVLAVAATLGLVASVARARNLSPTLAMTTAISGVVLAAMLSVAVPAAGANALDARSSDLRVTASDLSFGPNHLRAAAGDVGVIVRNDDLFWHTFTVKETNASVRIATGGRRRIALERLAPGTYHFVCAIPGHESAGMRGVLVVE